MPTCENPQVTIIEPIIKRKFFIPSFFDKGHQLIPEGKEKYSEVSNLAAEVSKWEFYTNHVHG